jgi:tetratricopeptide (TPR) repeat protein
MDSFYKGQTANKDALGKYFLKKAIDFAFGNKFHISYEYIVEGLNFLTCDCELGGWKERYNSSDKTLFNDLSIDKKDHIPYYFVKGYILSFEKELKDLYLALDAIEKYDRALKEKSYLVLKIEDVEIMLSDYIKGKIYLALEDYEKAFRFFYEYEGWNGSHFQILNYRSGLMKEEFSSLINYNFGKFDSDRGLRALYVSFIENPFSACCAAKLKMSINSYNFYMIPNPYTSNKLITLFLDNESNDSFLQRFVEITGDLTRHIDGYNPHLPGTQ